MAALLRGKLARAAQVILLALGPIAAASAQAALTPPFEEATSLSSDVDPIESVFNVPQSGAGHYQITLTDLGALRPAALGAAPLDSVHLLVTRGKQVVVSLDGDADKTSPVDTVMFDATPGDYKLHVVGKPGPVTGSGPVGIKIVNVATSNAVVNLSGTLARPPTDDDSVRTYQVELDVPTDGDYEMVLADLAFPHLNTLQASAFLVPAAASAALSCLNVPAVPNVCPSIQTASLTAGHYTLIVVGALTNPAESGLFSVQIRSVAAGTVLYGRTTELGRVKRVSDFSFKLDAGNYSLSLKDLAFPAQLGEVAAVVTRAEQTAALAGSTIGDANFTVAANNTPFDVFSFATADAAAGAGSYSVDVRPAARASVLSVLKTVGDSSGSPSVYTFDADIATAGTYHARLGDFQFPAALSSARMAIVQNSTVAGKTDPATGNAPSLDVPLVVGRATAIVVVKPATLGGSLTQSGGTFGLDLGLAGATQFVLDATQGVGGLVSVRKVSILQAGRYDLTVGDLNFPQTFHDLMVVVSRGSQKLGTVVVGSGASNPQAGSATLTDLDAAAGNYSITLIAQPGAPANAATYSLALAASPPAPTVTLAATPTSVPTGNSTALTWSSQGATSCTATSSPAGAWSGTKAISGTEGSAALSGATSFTLRCTDSAGRTAEKTVSVSISAPENNGGSGGGGGGALDWLSLAALALVGAARLGAARFGRSPRV
ncbi:MAG: hypothetical protein WDO56_23985 [Gammaproteobacteria bacterium]